MANHTKTGNKLFFQPEPLWSVPIPTFMQRLLVPNREIGHA
jgi:hypothetical protein